jgi:hypothetical protein
MKIITLIILLIGITLSATGCLTANSRTRWNNYRHGLQVADDNSNYRTLKQVEDTCRAMISSYNSDRMVYEQYKNSDNLEQRSWGEQAKMRANKTASSYNNYIMKNSYLWKNNVPDDIRMNLEYIK